jgi:hypothetical protein
MLKIAISMLVLGTAIALIRMLVISSIGTGTDIEIDRKFIWALSIVTLLERIFLVAGIGMLLAYFVIHFVTQQQKSPS